MGEQYDPLFTPAQIEYLAGILRLPCCHVTGMHDPRHYEERRYVCDIQKSRAYDKAVIALGLAEVDRQPQRRDTATNFDESIAPFPDEDCYWCGQYEATKRSGPQPIRHP